MKFFRRPGIRLQITLVFAAIFTLLSLLLNVYAYHRIRQLIVNDNDRYLMARARSILDKTEVSPVIIPLPDKYSAIRVMRRQQGRRVILFQSPGEIAKVSLPQSQGVVDTLGLRAAYLASQSDENPAELILAVSRQPLENTLKYLLLLLTACSLASVLVSAIVAYWLARFFLRPVRRITETARQINTLRLRERIPASGSKDEVQELADTINAMLQRIDDSVQQQQNFFASASHELKTPLAVMKAELEVTLSRPGIDPSIIPVMQSQLDEINRLQDVVEEFLVISRIREDRLRVRSDQFDLSTLTLRVFNRLQSLAARRQVKYSITFSEKDPDFSMVGDEEKIRLVLLNLVENAIKYSRPDDTVSCFVERMEGIMRLTIENPIEPETIETQSLAKAFYQGDPLHSGAGMGLWLCQQIVSAHHGTLTFRAAEHKFSAQLGLPNALPAAR